MKLGKVWGSTEQLLTTPMVEVHRLTILPNAHCSLHSHAHRWNAFIVLSGELLIEVHQKSYELIDTTVLGQNQTTTVAPGLLHQFRTGSKGAECLEIYYPSALGAEDIQRQSVGGRE